MTEPRSAEADEPDPHSATNEADELTASDPVSDEEARSMRTSAIGGARKARHTDPEDAAHDALLEILAKNRNPAVARRAGWFRAIDRGRRDRQRTRRELLQGPASERCPDPSPEDQVVGEQWARSIVALAARELTPAEYEGFVVLYERGGTVSDAARYLAETTGRDMETIRTQIRRGVAKLRKMAGDNDD